MSNRPHVPVTGTVGEGTGIVAEEGMEVVARGHGGGADVAYMVLRSCDVDAGEMTAQKLRYQDANHITPGDIEATGPVLTVYPAPGFFYDQFAPFVYPAGDEETYPLGTRVWPMRAMRLQGVWVIEPAFKMKPNVEFISASAVSACSREGASMVPVISLPASVRAW